MSARDTRYGRRGGGWVDGDPTTWREDFAAIRAANGNGSLRADTDIEEGTEQGAQLDLFGGDA